VGTRPRVSATQLATWGPPIIGGLALVILGYGAPFPSASLMALFTLFIALGQFLVIFPFSTGGYQTVGPMAMLPAIVMLGPVPAAIVAALGVGIGNGLLRRQTLPATAFNMGQRVLAILLAGAAWTSLLSEQAAFGPLPVPPETMLPAVLGAIGTYALTSTVLVDLYLAATRRQPFWKVLRGNVLWQTPTSGVLGASGLVIALLISGMLSPSEINSLVPLLLGSFIVLLSLLTTLAGEATAASRTAALFAEVQKGRDELQALHESAQALSASLELPTVLEALVSIPVRRFRCDRSAILLMDPSGNLVVRAALGDPAYVGRRVSSGEGAEGRAAQESRPVLVRATRSRADGSSAVDEGATLAVPLVREGRVIGVFSVGTTRPGALSERDERILTTLAGYAAVAIENAQLYEQTRRLAVSDGLTDLLNHRAFREALTREVQRAHQHGHPLSLIMIEIDKFKKYNDTYGHLRGDDVLRLVARVLEKEHRGLSDIVARYGGDEFILALPNTPKTAAAAMAERIRRAVDTSPLIVDGKVTSVTLSLGVAAYPEDGDDTDDLVDSADRRMYTAKESGGNSVAMTTVL
jgi:diguanylate cyclase (GGDEF)-like protein